MGRLASWAVLPAERVSQSLASGPGLGTLVLQRVRRSGVEVLQTVWSLSQSLSSVAVTRKEPQTLSKQINFIYGDKSLNFIKFPCVMK